MPGTGRVRLYRRGRIWWTWYYRDGRKHLCSTRCCSMRAAEVEARRIEERGVGARTASEAACTVEQALEELAGSDHGWSDGTERAHRSRARTINYYLGSTYLSGLGPQQLADYIAARRRDGASEHGIHKELQLVSQACRLQGKPIRLDHAPCYRPRERFLERREARLLLGALPESRRWWLQVALLTGCRLSELHGLDWADLDWGAGLLRVRGTKTPGSDRVLPLPPVLLGAMRKRRRDSGPIVERWSNARRDLCALAKALELAPVTPNDLRRTCASWMVQAGVPPATVAAWLGHRSLDMVMRVYGRLNPAALRVAADALPQLRPLRRTVAGTVATKCAVLTREDAPDAEPPE